MNRKDRQEFNDLMRRCAAAEAELAVARTTISELRVELTEVRAECRQERHVLLERIQRPEHEPVPAAVDGPPRKLHYTEDDELAGLTVIEVAEQAGLSAPHLYALAKVDEVARTEGIE